LGSSRSGPDAPGYKTYISVSDPLVLQPSSLMWRHCVSCFDCTQNCTQGGSARVLPYGNIRAVAIKVW